MNADLRDTLEKLHEASYGWALQCCRGEVEGAKEALQITYLKVLEGKAKFKGNSSFKTWFFAVLRNTAQELYRKQKGREKRAIGLEGLALPLERQDEDWDYQALGKSLQSLSEQQQALLHLVFYQNMSLNQAAQILEISGGAARKQYHRAKTKLKSLLENIRENG